LKDLVNVIQQEHSSSTDPIPQFLECLFVDFDFDGALDRLKQCEQVFQHDFFLHTFWEEFLECARRLIFEIYCRIHHKIEIGMLAQKLDMPNEAAERWVVDLIRTDFLNAKIDSQRNYVVMGSNFPNVYNYVMDKTKDLTFRTSLLANQIVKVNEDSQLHSKHYHKSTIGQFHQQTNKKKRK